MQAISQKGKLKQRQQHGQRGQSCRCLGNSRQETGIETGTTGETVRNTVKSQSINGWGKKMNTICWSASIERTYICYYALSVRIANDTVRNEQHFNCKFNISPSSFIVFAMIYFIFILLKQFLDILYKLKCITIYLMDRKIWYGINFGVDTWLHFIQL